jgi:hypothetical protein
MLHDLEQLAVIDQLRDRTDARLASDDAGRLNSRSVPAL